VWDIATLSGSSAIDYSRNGYFANSGGSTIAPAENFSTEFAFDRRGRDALLQRGQISLGPQAKGCCSALRPRKARDTLFRATETPFNMIVEARS